MHGQNLRAVLKRLSGTLETGELQLPGALDTGESQLAVTLPWKPASRFTVCVNLQAHATALKKTLFHKTV